MAEELGRRVVTALTAFGYASWYGGSRSGPAESGRDALSVDDAGSTVLVRVIQASDGRKERAYLDDIAADLAMATLLRVGRGWDEESLYLEVAE